MNARLRLGRALGLDGNPLRRSADRLETAVGLGLSAIFLICAPLLAVLAGRWTHQAGLAEQRAQRAWHQVAAVALQSAPQSDEVYASAWDDVGVLARWAAPGGAGHVGEIIAAGGIRAGQQVRIWVDGSGRQTGPPLSARQLTTRAIGVAGLAPAVLAAAFLSIGWLTRWQLTRRKLAAWESDWTLVEPEWTGHR
jgi:hypothetical protein